MRELDVVKLAAIGRTNAEIAQELFISIGTVKTHLASVQTKLDARNRVEIAAWAWEFRLVGQKQDPRPVRGQKPRSAPSTRIRVMKKLLLLIPVLALTVPGGASQSETVDLPVKDRAMLANALGRITLTVKPQTGQATCKLRVEKEEEITNAGAEAKCEHEITESTDN